MKKLSALSLLALGLCIIPALSAADKKVTAKTDPKAVAKPAVTAPAAKPEPEKPVVGILIERKDASKGFLNLKVDGGAFVITFLDKDKKEIDADLFRAIIRYRRHLQNSQFILNRSADGKSLRSMGAPVDRPYVYPALPVRLFKEGQEDVAEAYTVGFKQFMPGDGEGIPADQMTPEQLQKAPPPQ